MTNGAIVHDALLVALIVLVLVCALLFLVSGLKKP